MKKIYILEDDNILAELTEHILQRHGFDILTFKNNKDLSSQMDSKRPDLLILDNLLNGPQTGLEICRQIKSTTDYRSIPILLTTGQNIDFTVKDNKNPDDYLKKPFDPNILIKKIEKLLKS